MNVDIFVQNVKAICRAHGTTPTVACAESGAGKDMVSDAKRRGSIPSVEKVQKLATYLGVTIGDLLCENKEPTTASDDGPPAEIMDLLRRVPADRWPEVERYLRFQAGQEGTS